MKASPKSRHFREKLPLITGGVAALLWGLAYFLSAQLHGMQGTFNPMFPFIVAKLFGFDPASISVLTGTFFATLDAGIVGAILAYLIRFMFIKDGQGQSATNR